ncbi:MAG: hypothetical protein K6U80_09505 [Firmicutes bacterium]|nr:hypothetical protein [Bacillota bacterium]
MKLKPKLLHQSSYKSKKKRRGGKIVFWAILAIILAQAANYGVYFILRGPLPPKVLVIAHRGASALAPENTLAAFREAGRLKTDGIELDVRMAKDGELVIMHDETVERTTDGLGAVRDLTFQKLRALTVNGGEFVPTFAEALTVARENQQDIYAEIKSGRLYPGIEAKMVETAAAANYEAHTRFLSFEPESLKKAAALNPRISLIALYGLGKLRLGKIQPGVNSVSLMAEMVLLNPWMIKEAKKQGKQVYVWAGIIENPVTVSIMRAFGAEGLIVNNPKYVKQ